MKTKLIIITILSIFLANCGGSKSNNTKLDFTTNPPFKVQEVSSQKWVAGVKGGGAGTNLFITFSEVSKGVVFKELYFRNKKVEVSVFKDKVVGYFKNQNNRDVIMDGDFTKEASNIPPEKIPFQLNKNEAVVSYLEKNQLHYFKISNIEEKEILAYPKSNPKIEN